MATLKLSQLKTKDAIRIMADIAEPLEKILNDQAILKEIRTAIAPITKTEKGKKVNLTPGVKSFLALFVQIFPAIIEKHEDNIYKILSPFLGITPDEVGENNFLDIMEKSKEIFDDEAFKSFLERLLLSKSKAPTSDMKE